MARGGPPIAIVLLTKLGAPHIPPTTPVDYSAAGAYHREVRAFSIIESSEQLWAVGDGGQAFGLVQIHPATFIDYYRDVADVADTWPVASIKACAWFLGFYNFKTAKPDMQDLVVQAWNLGRHAVFLDGRRNLEYLSKWKAAYQHIARGYEIS